VHNMTIHGAEQIHHSHRAMGLDTTEWSTPPPRRCLY